MNRPIQPRVLAHLRGFVDYFGSWAAALGLILIFAIVSACSPSQSTSTMDPAPTTPVVLPTEPEPIPTETEVPTEVPTPVPSPSPISVSISPDNLSGLEILHQLQGHTGNVTDVAISADNLLIASSSADGTVRVWDAVDGNELFQLQGHLGTVNSVVFSKDGLTLASGGDDRIVRIWDMQNGELLQEIKSGLIGRVLRVEYSPDGNLLAIAGHYCFTELRQARSGILRRTLPQPGCVSRWDGSVAYWGMDFSPDSTYIATGDSQAQSDLGSIYHWIVDQYIAPDLVKGNRFLVRDLSYSPKGKQLVVALLGGYEFWLIDIDSRDVLQRYQGHTLRVNGVDFAPDGELIGSASRDRSLRLWDPTSGESLGLLLGHDDAVNSLVFSEDGSLIVSGSDDDTVIVWGFPK